MSDYVTVKDKASGELTEKRSRFIGDLFPVSSVEEALAIVASVKKEHHDARHSAWAFSLPSGECRSSDDGEPAGTAGAPILDVITRSGLSGVLIVVTRYFGGILLGTGGLVRAYSGAASLAAEKAVRVNMAQGTMCSLCCTYGQYGRVSTLITDRGRLMSASYGEKAEVLFWLPDGSEGGFEKELADLTGGTVSFEMHEKACIEN